MKSYTVVRKKEKGNFWINFLPMVFTNIFFVFMGNLVIAALFFQEEVIVNKIIGMTLVMSLTSSIIVSFIYAIENYDTEEVEVKETIELEEVKRNRK